MSLKTVELQVAIPRTQDAGKMQEQLNKQGQQFQETLTEKQLKEEQLKRQQVNKYDDVEKRDVSDDEEQAQHQEREKKQKKQQKIENQAHKTNHPYIGNRIDFSR